MVGVGDGAALRAGCGDASGTSGEVRVRPRSGMLAGTSSSLLRSDPR